MIGIAQNDIHTLLHTSSRQNLDVNFNLAFSDTISYENFYVASLLQKKTKQFENVIAYRLILLKPILSAVT